MPRRNYRKGRRRPSDPRGEYSRAQVAALTTQEMAEDLVIRGLASRIILDLGATQHGAR